MADNKSVLQLDCLWRVGGNEGSVCLIVSTILFGFYFSTLLLLQDSLEFQIVRAFLVGATASVAVAMVLSSSSMFVYRRLQILVYTDTEAEHKITMRRYYLLRICSATLVLAEFFFTFSIVMLLGALFRYSIQAFGDAATIISLVSISIATVGIFLAAFLSCIGWLLSR